MTQYHLLLTENPKTQNKVVTARDEATLHKVYKEINQSTQKLSQSLAKKNKKSKTELYYLYETKSIETLGQQLKDGDEILVHAEGFPFCIGLSEPSSYDLSAYTFATYIGDHNFIPKDKSITLSLLSCNSASLFISAKHNNMPFQFAKDLSKGLSVLYNYHNLFVKGYTGLVVDKGNGKYSVASCLDEDRDQLKIKQTHASLQDAEEIYKNGEVVTAAKKIVAELTVYEDWATPYIAKAKEGNDLIYKDDTKLISKNENALNQALLCLNFISNQRRADEQNDTKLTESILQHKL
ncbi:MAG: hypothetical protein CK426_06315 [Legionella sp.]|nr:MAG: hypothetical protein CK423_02535 [Legionella sp.]PJD98504.1 MAG: hypothetical protein CK426_06315 [Legionella sp.]